MDEVFGGSDSLERSLQCLLAAETFGFNIADARFCKRPSKRLRTARNVFALSKVFGQQQSGYSLLNHCSFCQSNMYFETPKWHCARVILLPALPFGEVRIFLDSCVIFVAASDLFRLPVQRLKREVVLG